MGYVGYLVVLAVFLGISWFVRLMVMQSVTRRVDHNLTRNAPALRTCTRELE